MERDGFDLARLQPALLDRRAARKELGVPEGDSLVVYTGRATAGKGVDVIVDIIAGDYVARNYQSAAMNGRIVQ